MKKAILSIATYLLLATGLQAQCPSVTLPWNETFANGTSCWYKPTGSQWHDAIPFNDSQYEYMRYLFLQMRDDPQGSWIISREIQIPSTSNGTAVLFWKVATNDTNYHLHYSVMVTTSSNYTDTSTYTEVYYDNATHVYWYNYDQLSVSLAQFAGQNIHIAFHNHPNMAPSVNRCVCIDDVEIRATTLPVVNLVAPTIVNSGDSVPLVASLTEGATAGISYTWHSSLLGTTWTTTADSAYVVYPSAGTDTFTVVASNSYGADTAVAVLTVIDNTTYIETFEDVAIGSLPVGWSYYWNGSNAAYAPHVIAPSGYQYLSGLPDNALLMLAGSSSGYGDRAEVMLPVYTDSLHHFSVAFDYRFESSTQGTLEVGYYNGSSFTVVQSMTPHTGSYQHATVNFANANVAHTPITFRWNCSSVWYALAIDNVEVHSDHALVIDTTTVIDTTVVVDTTVVDTVPPLPATCIPSGLPWHETFADGDDCWYKPAGCKWHDAIPYNDPDYESQRYIYLNTGRDTVGSWIMSREIQIPADTNLQPLLSWRVSSSSYSYHHHYAVLITDSTNFTNTANYTVIFDDHTAHPNWSNWDTVSVSLTQYVGRNIHVAFHNYPDLTQSELNGLLIDDVMITAQDIPVVSLSAPSDVFLDDIVSFEATLTEGSTAGLYYTWHSALMDTTWVDTLPISSSIFQLIYDTAGTDTLTVAVSNIFGTGSALALVHAIDCRARALPFTENFEEVTTVDGINVGGYLPTCWGSVCDCINPAYAPHVILGYTWANHLPDNALMMKAGAAEGADNLVEVTLPSFADSLQHLSIAFDYQFRYSIHGTLQVGYYNGSVFNVVETMTPYQRNEGESCYRRDTVSFANATVPDAQITIRWSNAHMNGVVIDNIEVFSDGTAVIDTTPMLLPDTVWRTVTVTANVEDVCQPYGSGVYADSSTVDIGYTMLDSVTEGGHWLFLGWNDSATDNPRQIVVTSDTVIVALFQWVADSVGIGNIAVDGISIRSTGDCIVVKGASDEVSVFDMMGRMVATAKGDEVTIPLPAAGVYLVRINNRVAKKVVVIK